VFSAKELILKIAFVSKYVAHFCRSEVLCVCGVQLRVNPVVK
jgi:hypothetical protein